MAEIDPADVELLANATQAHHIVTGQTDATGNSPCVCGEWWDSAEMEGWDEHMAAVSLAALGSRLLPPGGKERTDWGYQSVWPDGTVRHMKTSSREEAEFMVRDPRTPPGITRSVIYRRRYEGPWLNVEEGTTP